MKNDWSDCKNILCIRLDNLGDLLMSSPAIRALKESFGCKITVLTSSMASGIAKHITEIDEVICFNVPWVQSESYAGAADYLELVALLKSRNFDGAIIFTVFSQNPLPAVMLAYLAEIPNRLAYCRENPYRLLTAWIPEQEPYNYIRHQVIRDLDLVAAVGAGTNDQSLSLKVPVRAYQTIKQKLKRRGIVLSDPWIMVHPGASEKKREFPDDLLVTILLQVMKLTGAQVLLTGIEKEKWLTDSIQVRLGDRSHSLAGMLTLEEFMALIDLAPAALSVNTGAIHIAAALKTPLVVLYANTNPQHTPWQSRHEVFFFPVPDDLKSRNEVLRYVQDRLMVKCDKLPGTDEVVNSTVRMLAYGYETNKTLTLEGRT